MVSAPVRVCFVCTGNICRSPTAEVVLRAQARDADLSDLVVIDSAGTGTWHVGDDLDPRARRTLVDAGYDARRHEADVFTAEDFAERDIVVALDSSHHRLLWELAGDTDDVLGARAKIVMLRTFDPELPLGADPDVPDPFYGGASGFTDVLAQIERSCTNLLAMIRAQVESAR